MSTEIVPFQPPQPKGTSLELAPEAWKLAQKVATTDFVPKALRGKPEAVLACILAGHEAGISPMQALSKIHVVEGRPAMAAELMRALVMRAGHEIWIEESTQSRVIVCGQRAGSERVSRVVWTIDDARRAGLAGKNNWKSYPRAMLTARATSELCRMIFPDVLAGISHTIEEIADGVDVDDVFGIPEVAEPTAPAPSTTSVTATHRATSAPAEEASVETVAEPPRGEIPDLPGEDDDIIDAEVVDDPSEAQDETGGDEDAPHPEIVDESDEEDPIRDDWQDGDFPPDDDPPIENEAGRLTGPQIIAMRLSKYGVTARPDKLRAVSKIIDREVGTTNDLTSDEIRLVLETLDQLPEGTVLLAGQDVDEAPPDPPAAPARRTAVTPPAEWTREKWTAFIKGRKITITKFLKQAREIGAAQDQPVVIATIDDVVGSPIVDDLIAWIEEETAS